MTLQTVKLSQLRLSPLNVRRVKPKAIDQLAADMLAHGQLQNLVVYAEGNRFEVAAGGRRYRAFKQLEKAKAISASHPVSVDVRDKAEAVELSLAENVSREDMHVADAVIAYADAPELVETLATLKMGEEEAGYRGEGWSDVRASLERPDDYYNLVTVHAEGKREPTEAEQAERARIQEAADARLAELGKGNQWGDRVFNGLEREARILESRLCVFTDAQKAGSAMVLFVGNGGEIEAKAIRAKRIAKGVRQLGIPTVVDRLVQQAILQVLEPMFDPTFSASSYGFRPGRSAHDALRQAREYVTDGRGIVVDIDLEKFFDRVNHDVAMSRLARRLGDKRLLAIIRRFLRAGMMADGVCVERQEGTPQGGPLSPLIANLLLDDLDKELERRGHRFCRYADDCNIYVRSKAAGERVMASVTAFLEGNLRLRVNRDKSAVAPVEERAFLGYRLWYTGGLGIAPKSLSRMKDRLRAITRRNRGIPFKTMIAQVNAFTMGWVTYYRLAREVRALRQTDQWLRRKLRCARLKQCKRKRSTAHFLRKCGVPATRAWLLAGSGKGWWRMAGSPPAAEAMTIAWFTNQRLVSLADHHAALNITGNRRGT